MKMLTNTQIKELAIRADLPKGWYDGPYFIDAELKVGLSPQMIRFVELVAEELQNG